MREVVDDGFDFVGFRVRPWILARTASRLSGEAAGLTVTRLPTGFGEAPERRLGKADFVGAHQAVLIGDQERCQQDFRVRSSSTRLNPRKTSGRKAFECREITTTFSRPVRG